MSISEKQDEKVIGKQRIMGEAETEEHLLAYAEKDYACWLMQRKTSQLFNILVPLLYSKIISEHNINQAKRITAASFSAKKMVLLTNLQT